VARASRIAAVMAAARMARSLQAFLLAATVASCHAATRAPAGGIGLKPDAAEGIETASTAVAQLRRDIDALFADPALARGFWGVLIKSLKTDETLYTLNARKLMMPASNMKIVTLAAAVEKLGWDYTYETTVRIAGRIDNGVLEGDLVVVGSGDPSLMAADGSADGLFSRWAGQLEAAGVRSIAGRIVGDDNTFDDETLGFGWSWDDLPDDYAAGVGALQLNEDAVRITVVPGAAAGDVGARRSAHEGEPESVRGNAAQDDWAVGGRRDGGEWTDGRASDPATVGRGAKRGDSAGRIGLVALRLRDARGARHDSRARRSRSAAERAVRGLAADRRPRRYALEPDERDGGREQR